MSGRIFQTVSPRTSANKGKKKDRGLAFGVAPPSSALSVSLRACRGVSFADSLAVHVRVDGVIDSPIGDLGVNVDGVGAGPAVNGIVRVPVSNVYRVVAFDASAGVVGLAVGV